LILLFVLMMLSLNTGIAISKSGPIPENADN